MFSIISIIRRWFSSVDRCANPQPETREESLRRRWRENGDTEALGELLRMFCHVEPLPSIPAADSGPPPDDVRGDAVSSPSQNCSSPEKVGQFCDGASHIPTGPRLSHDVPTLPVEHATVNTTFGTHPRCRTDITFAPIQVAALAEPFPHPNAGTQLFTV